MIKLMTLTLALYAIALAAPAADGEKPQRKRPELTEEQKKIRQEITAKYDKNKDGRLDKDERAAMSAEDKEKLAKITGARRAPAKKPEGDK